MSFDQRNYKIYYNITKIDLLYSILFDINVYVKYKTMPKVDGSMTIIDLPEKEMAANFA